jgi:hypothetical protein
MLDGSTSHKNVTDGVVGAKVKLVELFILLKNIIDSKSQMLINLYMFLTSAYLTWHKLSVW